MSSRLLRWQAKPLFIVSVGLLHLASALWFPVLLPLNYIYAPALAFLFPIRGAWGGTLGTVLSVAALAPFYFLPPFGAGYSLLLFSMVLFATFWVRLFAVLLPPLVAIRLFAGILTLEYLLFPFQGLPLLLILCTALLLDVFRRSSPERLVDTLQWLVLTSVTLATYRF
ncbi:MAG: hypothetical protein V2G51_03985 [bacterium JZ-2024 1]